MKGPGFPIELAALREFVCGECGRILHLPAWTTSHRCNCTDKATFMKAVDRKPVTTPDISAFISEVEEDEVEEEEPELVLEPRTPRPAPRPREIPGRRRLEEDLSKYGDDIEELKEPPIPRESSREGRGRGRRRNRGPRRRDSSGSLSPTTGADTANSRKPNSSADDGTDRNEQSSPARSRRNRRPRRRTSGSSTSDTPTNSATSQEAFGAGLESQGAGPDSNSSGKRPGTAGRGRQRRRRPRSGGQSQSGENSSPAGES